MFSYQLDQRDLVSKDRHGHLKFDPPIIQQRYSAALHILENRRWSAQLKKVVDFGCGDMGLLPLVRRIETVEHIMEVDTDEHCIEFFKQRGVPLTVDYLKKRARPLRVEMFRGSIADSVENLRNVDAVIALDIIEYLMPDVLEKVPKNIFGFIQPKLAIVSTPNRDFNVLLHGLNENGFRVNGHKFEWTRKEFRDWAKTICLQYPNYSVAFVGIGSPPPTHKKLGHITQIAIFARNDLIYRPLKASILTELPSDTRPEVQYKTIYEVDFPYDDDDRTIMQKIKDEASHYIERSQRVPRFYNRERFIYQIPISHLNEYAQSIKGKPEDVLSALQELKFQVENEFIVLTEEYVEENYRMPGIDFDGDDDDFLDFEPYQYDEEKDGDQTPNTSKIVDDNEPEECWD